MRLVITDTSPINYLILIGHIDVLSALFDRVVLPSIVRDELSHPKAPAAVRNWIAATPAWVEIRETAYVHNPALDELDAGEEDVLALAAELHADLLLIDDRAAILVAVSKGFRSLAHWAFSLWQLDINFSISMMLINGSSARPSTTVRR